MLFFVYFLALDQSPILQKMPYKFNVTILKAILHKGIYNNSTLVISFIECNGEHCVKVSVYYYEVLPNTLKLIGYYK